MNNLEKLRFVFEELNLLNLTANFMCYADGIATYDIHVSDTECYQLSIINHHYIFFHEEEVRKLIMAERIDFADWNCRNTETGETTNNGFNFVRSLDAPENHLMN